MLFVPIIAVGLLFIICSYLFIKFVLYVFCSFAILNIATEQNYNKRYLAWIPGIGNYLFGKYFLNNKENKVYTIVSTLKIVFNATYLLSTDVSRLIGLNIYIVVLLAYFIYDMVIIDKFYKKAFKTPQLFLMLTIFSLGILKPIFMYMRKIKKIRSEQ